MSLHLWICAAILTQPPIKRHRIYFNAEDFMDYYPGPDGSAPPEVIELLAEDNYVPVIDVNFHPKFQIHIN